jgi:monovalent cation/proton antiporter MnhG/PhaG subunit
VIVQDVVSDVLLGLAVITLLISSLGVAVMGDVYQKIHFVTPAALVAPALVALAVTVQEGYSENTTETWLAVFFVAIAGPVLSHATIRAARIRERGDWRPGQGEAAGVREQEE